MNTKCIIGIGVLLCAQLIIANNCFAQNDLGLYDGWYEKLGRGITNVVTAPIEIGRGVSLNWMDRGPVHGWTNGLGKGFLNMFKRCGAGLVEIGTFPFKTPDEFKKPIIRPEYVWQEWNILYS